MLTPSVMSRSAAWGEVIDDQNCYETQCRTPRHQSDSNASPSEDGLQGPARLGSYPPPRPRGPTILRIPGEPFTFDRQQLHLRRLASPPSDDSPALASRH